MKLSVWGLNLLLLAAVFTGANSVQAAEEKVEQLKEKPAGLSAEVASAINETGYRITGQDGAVCDIWLAKELPLKDGYFEMTLPRAFFEGNPMTITVAWIDFYRN